MYFYEVALNFEYSPNSFRKSIFIIFDQYKALTQSFTEEKKGLDFSPRSGEATSGEK